MMTAPRSALLSSFALTLVVVLAAGCGKKAPEKAAPGTAASAPSSPEGGQPPATEAAAPAESAAAPTTSPAAPAAPTEPTAAPAQPTAAPTTAPAAAGSEPPIDCVAACAKQFRCAVGATPGLQPNDQARQACTMGCQTAVANNHQAMLKNFRALNDCAENDCANFMRCVEANVRPVAPTAAGEPPAAAGEPGK